jgi:glutaredoxin
MKRIVLLTALLMAASAQAGELYRWVDSAGKVHYGDAPPPAVEADEKKFSGPAESDTGLSYATRRVMKSFPVTLYVADNCTDICERARELLKQRGIPFDEKKLVTQEEIDAFKAASGGDSVPALGVGRTIVNGFEAGRWHGELDIAGYPKLVPYRPRQVPVPKAPPAETAAP